MPRDVDGYTVRCKVDQRQATWLEACDDLAEVLGGCADSLREHARVSRFQPGPPMMVTEPTMMLPTWAKHQCYPFNPPKGGE